MRLRPVVMLSSLVALAAVFLPSHVLAQDVAGPWTIDVSAPEGAMSFGLVLAVDGEKVTGTTDSDETFTGTFKDGVLLISGNFYIAEAGYAAKMELNGQVDGERLRGEATWDGYPLSLRGRRPS